MSLPGSVIEVGVGAFSDCIDLEYVSLNEGLARLKKEALDLTISAKEDSYAADYAQKMGIPLKTVY